MYALSYQPQQQQQQNQPPPHPITGNSGGGFPPASTFAPAYQGRLSDQIKSSLSQWNSKLAEENAGMQKLDEEDRSLDAEEASIRTRLAQIASENRAVDQEMLAMQQGWATCYQKEHQYHTEVVPDLTPEISALECRLAQVRGEHERMSSEVMYAKTKLAALAHVEDQKKQDLGDLSELGKKLERLAKRRRDALVKMELLQECEAKRHTEATQHAQHLLACSNQVRVIPSGQQHPSNTTSSSTVAPVHTRRVVMSTADSSRQSGGIQQHQAGDTVENDLSAPSFCIGMAEEEEEEEDGRPPVGSGGVAPRRLEEEEEEDEHPLGGRSVMYSLCNSKKARKEGGRKVQIAV